MFEFQEPGVSLQQKNLKEMELVQPLTPNTEFVFINDYLRVHEWVSKTVIFNSLEGIIKVLSISMFPKMDLVHPSKIKEVLITSLNLITPVSN